MRIEIDAMNCITTSLVLLHIETYVMHFHATAFA